MMIDDKHPEQDPAEGSRETVEKDLKRQEQVRSHSSKEPTSENDAGSEAAEPSPE
ncbi:hypothetical protein [Rhizobium sp. Root1204]|uniref:hypothetical protein n=1 Tax=Rhizobium sp. Root1204 TaxID=1736428 RepID=UPI000A7EBE87|nr:hypothetical protein [Rhizobium sp. Root1204]